MSDTNYRRVKVSDVKKGMRTEHWTALRDATVHNAHRVTCPVAWHDGGEAVREWDYHLIEIEIENVSNDNKEHSDG